MQSILIVSSNPKATEFFECTLKQNSPGEIVTLDNADEARCVLIEKDFDLCIINAPLPDEFGELLASNISQKGICQVILVVSVELADKISAKLENSGVFIITKPISKNAFWNTFKLAGTTYKRMSKLKEGNTKLQQKIEDVRIVDRAKCMLIEYLSMSEMEAHRYIEKQAMDLRVSKKQIAENILKIYEG